jgi:hypothetical protein
MTDSDSVNSLLNRMVQQGEQRVAHTASDTINQLRADNERLRYALAKIYESVCHQPDKLRLRYNREECAAIARIALQVDK